MPRSFRFLCLFCLLCLMAACGNKGDLVKPEASAGATAQSAN